MGLTLLRARAALARRRGVIPLVEGMITILIVLTLLTQPLQATWDGPHRARITHGPGCLWKGNTFIQCYEKEGVLTLGDKGPLDHAYRPAAGDIFRLVRPGGAVEVAHLRGVLYFPVFR
jgi:hypothetical protein